MKACEIGFGVVEHDCCGFICKSASRSSGNVGGSIHELRIGAFDKGGGDTVAGERDIYIVIPIIGDVEAVGGGRC